MRQRFSGFLKSNLWKDKKFRIIFSIIVSILIVIVLLLGIGYFALKRGNRNYEQRDFSEAVKFYAISDFLSFGLNSRAKLRMEKALDNLKEDIISTIKPSPIFTITSTPIPTIKPKPIVPTASPINTPTSIMVVGIDNNKPNFDKIEIASNKVRRDQIITVFIYATDGESGLDRGDIRASDDTGDLDIRSDGSCKKIAESKLECPLTIPSYGKIGTWHINYANIRDIAGHELHIDFGSNQYTFQVE